MSAHTPTNLIRSFRCSAQEGFCAASVSQGVQRWRARDTSYSFIDSEVQLPASLFQHLVNLEVTLAILDLQGFSLHPSHLLCVCCPGSSNTPLFSCLCFSLCWREREKPSLFQAWINELTSISESCCHITKPEKGKKKKTCDLCFTMTHIYLKQVSDEFQFVAIIKITDCLGGPVSSS